MERNKEQEAIESYRLSFKGLAESLNEKYEELDRDLRNEIDRLTKEVVNLQLLLSAGLKGNGLDAVGRSVFSIEDGSSAVGDDLTRVLSLLAEENEKVLELTQSMLDQARDLSSVRQKLIKRTADIKRYQKKLALVEKEKAEIEQEVVYEKKRNKELMKTISQKDDLLSQYWNRIQYMRLTNRLKRLFFFKIREPHPVTTVAINEVTSVSSAERSPLTDVRTRSEFVSPALPNQKKIESPIRLFQTLKGDQSTVTAYIKKLVHKMWFNYSRIVIPELCRLLEGKDITNEERGLICYELACWFSSEGNFTRAADFVADFRNYNPKSRNRLANMLEAECLRGLGRFDEAKRLAEHLVETAGKDIDYLLILFNCTLALKSRKIGSEGLAILNQIFSSQGLMPVRAKGGTFRSVYDLVAPTPTFPRRGQPKISVIFSLDTERWNKKEVECSFESVIQQTWGNIEVLIVGPDAMDTKSLKSTRRKVFFYEYAGGNRYAAQNIGMEKATGEYIFMVSPGQWLHPQKLEILAGQLLKKPELKALVANAVPFREDKSFVMLRPGKQSFIMPYPSSTMYCAEVRDLLGGMDCVRFGAEIEFNERIRAHFGASAIEILDSVGPLSFVPYSKETASDAKNAKSVNIGLLREYREAFSHWHSTTGRENLSMAFRQKSVERKFPVPLKLDLGVEKAKSYDLVVIGDFILRGGAFVSTINYVKAAARQGLSVAIFHWRRFDLNGEHVLKSDVRQLCSEWCIDILTIDDAVEATTVLVGYPVILNEKLDHVPSIKAKTLAILVNQTADRLSSGEDNAYDPRLVDQNMRELFNVIPCWIPISGRVRSYMLDDWRYPRPYREDWSPLIDVDTWCVRPLRWRGGSGCLPVLGRHSRDHYTKWPSQKQDILDAYCAEKPCEVRLLGGAESALKIIGTQPTNWEVLDFAETTYAFLEGLDFFVHYTHELLVEAFGRVVLEAMAVGIPVILPPVFRDTFGEAAIYAEPSEVWHIMDRLWKDEEAYLRRCAMGRQFCLSKASYEEFVYRLERLQGNEKTTKDT